MKSQTIPVAAAAAAILSSTSFAAMTGVCASVHRTGGYTMVDLYATMNAQSDLLQFMSLRTLTTTAAGGFVQGSSPGLKGWAPDVNFTSTRDSLDSFLTLGGSQYGNPAGPYYANLSLFPSAGWSNGTWTGTPPSAPSNSLTSDVTISWSVISTDTKARGISLAGLEGRMNVQGNAEGSNWGVWFAHLVVAGDAPFNVTFGTWGAYYQDSPYYTRTYVDGGQLSFTVLPAPGAIAVLACAGLAPRRRRFLIP
jgi:hypothetical protein